jgi:hypothetical protein
MEQMVFWYVVEYLFIFLYFSIILLFMTVFIEL